MGIPNFAAGVHSSGIKMLFTLLGFTFTLLLSKKGKEKKRQTNKQTNNQGEEGRKYQHLRGTRRAAPTCCDGWTDGWMDGWAGNVF